MLDKFTRMVIVYSSFLYLSLINPAVYDQLKELVLKAQIVTGALENIIMHGVRIIYSTAKGYYK